jgi:hypothetical protein
MHSPNAFPVSAEYSRYGYGDFLTAFFLGQEFGNLAASELSLRLSLLRKEVSTLRNLIVKDLDF